MNIPELIQNYGYAAVAVGTFLEGETVLLLAGAAASRGHQAAVRQPGREARLTAQRCREIVRRSAPIDIPEGARPLGRALSTPS